MDKKIPIDYISEEMTVQNHIAALVTLTHGYDNDHPPIMPNIKVYWMV